MPFNAKISLIEQPVLRIGLNLIKNHRMELRSKFPIYQHLAYFNLYFLENTRPRNIY